MENKTKHEVSQTLNPKPEAGDLGGGHWAPWCTSGLSRPNREAAFPCRRRGSLAASSGTKLVIGFRVQGLVTIVVLVAKTFKRVIAVLTMRLLKKA